jgi:hypothetical protein
LRDQLADQVAGIEGDAGGAESLDEFASLHRSIPPVKSKSW